MYSLKTRLNTNANASWEYSQTCMVLTWSGVNYEPVHDCQRIKLHILWSRQNLFTFLLQIKPTVPRCFQLGSVSNSPAAVQRNIAMEIVCGKARASWKCTVSIIMVGSSADVAPSERQLQFRVEAWDYGFILKVLLPFNSDSLLSQRMYFYLSLQIKRCKVYATATF